MENKLVLADSRALAKKMRHNPTRAEFLLWQNLRNKKMGARFHRQKVILGYIVDFYCPKAKLAIEVDGAGHDRMRDAWRDTVLLQHGVAVARFTNEQVVRAGIAVLQVIRSTVSSRIQNAQPDSQKSA